jgi:hypothetical protein
MEGVFCALFLSENIYPYQIETSPKVMNVQILGISS